MVPSYFDTCHSVHKGPHKNECELNWSNFIFYANYTLKADGNGSQSRNVINFIVFTLRTTVFATCHGACDVNKKDKYFIL